MAAINLMDLTENEKENFINSFDYVISDCDGVLWHSKTPIPGAIKVMNSWPSKNKKRFFFTNNSTMTRKGFVDKFQALGFDANEDEILSTSWLTAQYLKNLNFKKKVYTIGMPALEEELSKVGLTAFGAGADPYPEDEMKLDDLKLDPEVGAVVIGYDFHFSWVKLTKGCTYLSDPTCLFIATNRDERFPVSNNLSRPGAGSFVASLATCTEREPKVIGKPSTLAVDTVLIPNGVNPKRCLMIGDRCNTDVQFGNESGMTTLLVETGVHNRDHLRQYTAENQDHLVPKYYTSSIADLIQILKLS